jgi:chromosome segregation ATPase
MTCIHTKQALEKINNLIGLMNNSSSCFYEELGKYVKENEVDGLLAGTRTNCTVTSIRRVRQSSLYDHLSDLFDILKGCDCRNEVVNDYNALVVKHNDINSQHAQMQMEVASLRTRSENYFSQLVDVRKLLENKEERITGLENKLDRKQLKIDSLIKRLADLKIDNSEKVGKIREKEIENETLNENLGETKKDLLSERLEYKKEKLETFATQLGIELQRIQKLRKRYRGLLMAQENNNSNDANIARENITATKEGLVESGISVNSIQKLCKKCEKVSKLELQLEKTHEQYRAQQEVPINN